MNLHELKIKLEEKTIPNNVYSLDGGLRHDTYCIEKVRSGLEVYYEVYYTELGEKYEVKRFSSENEACNYFFEWLTTMLQKMRQYKDLFK